MPSFAAGAAGPGLAEVDPELALEEERPPGEREIERRERRSVDTSDLCRVHRREFARHANAANSDSQYECGRYTAMVVHSGGQAPGEDRTIGPEDEVQHLDVDLYQSDDGSVYATGLKKCGSPWSCPSCAEEIARRHAAILEDCIELWRRRGGAEYMLTLTMPHDAGDDLEDVKEALQEAWSYTTGGTPWKRLEEEIGLAWYARGFDATHGYRHGWHAHFHVLLGTRGELTEDQIERFLTGWDEDGRHYDGVYDRWNRAIESFHRTEDGELERATLSYPDYELPEDHVPAFGSVHPERGVVLSERDRAGWYVSKMGLSSEPTRMDAKEAAGDHRTPRQILADYAVQGRDRDAALWAEWCRVMKGCRKLYRSNRLMELVRELEERPEVVQESLELEPESEEERHLVQIQGRLWDAASSRAEKEGDHLLLDLREVVESVGRELEYLRRILASYVDRGEVRLDENHSRIWWKR